MKWSSNLHKLGLATRVLAGVAQSRLSASDPEPGAEPGRLVGFEGFGDNPGRLRMLAHLPTVTAGRPLVVLLHGCGQDAAQFAAGSGWTRAADRLQFALILPEQQEANHSGRCFQWFHPSDTGRDQGEAGSIAAMTRAAIDRFGTDASRVFVVGLSAGGAMAAAMLAAYPDLFAAGASVAGLPVGAARSGMQGLMRMASASPGDDPSVWASAGYAGHRPRLSIWHGMADHKVAPENALLLATQWRALHGLDGASMTEQKADGTLHQTWPVGGQAVVEQWSLPKLGHAYPVGAPADDAGPFVAAGSVDATQEIARFLGLDDS